MKSFAKEFKDFLMNGNLVEIAVGLILALSFKAVVDEVVNVINQAIAALLGSTTPFGELAITWGADAEGKGGKSIVYGGLLNALFSFIVVGLVLFLIVKAYNKAVDMTGRTKEEEDEASEVDLLVEIRDLLRQRQP